MEEQSSTVKRLFFGLEAQGQWPEHLPPGRAIELQARHATLAFLGNVDFQPLETYLAEIPTPPFKVGGVAIADRLLFLPQRRPRVVAWHLRWWEHDLRVQQYQKQITHFLREKGYDLDIRDFLPHVTLARQPRDFALWHKQFQPSVVQLLNLHLYESTGRLRYTPIWTHSLLHPFSEVEHTADIAFIIRGETTQELGIHAQAALCSSYPELINFRTPMDEVEGIDDIVIRLNENIARADEEVGCGLKAVSFHGDIGEEKGVLKWEMIADV